MWRETLWTRANANSTFEMVSMPAAEERLVHDFLISGSQESSCDSVKTAW
jgi:hypothetical protein